MGKGHGEACSQHTLFLWTCGLAIASTIAQTPRGHRVPCRQARVLPSIGAPAPPLPSCTMVRTAHDSPSC